MRFTTTLVPYMFFLDSAIKAIEMRTLTKPIGAFAAALVMTCPITTFAQDAEDGRQTSRPMAGGYRVATTSDGFQLVEHDVWSQQERIVELDQAKQATSPLSALPKRRRASDYRPSGFRRAGYLPHIFAAETQFALPRGLLDALVWTESRYNPFAISKAGAVGLGQLMAGTARDMGVANRYDPQANIFGAARYLRQMIDKFGVVHLALAAYNAGPRAVERAGGIPRNGETPAYVRNVLQSWRN